MKHVQIENAHLYLGDCREILPSLPDGIADVIITDPPWPGSVVDFPGMDDPVKLFSEVTPLLPRISERLIVQLGCDTDPRMLQYVPLDYEFSRVASLEYVRPAYKGRKLMSGDIAYIYGPPPKTRKYRHVLPGRYLCTGRQSPWKGPHPCPRRLEHVDWLIRWYADGLVLDPFMGSGTTGIAAVENDQPFIGIEIHEPFFDISCQRVEEAAAQQKLFKLISTKEDDLAGTPIELLQDPTGRRVESFPAGRDRDTFGPA